MIDAVVGHPASSPKEPLSSRDLSPDLTGHSDIEKPHGNKEVAPFLGRHAGRGQKTRGGEKPGTGSGPEGSGGADRHGLFGAWSWSICGLTTRRPTTLNLTTGPSVTWFGDGLRSGGGIQKLYEVLKSRYQKRDSGKPWVFCIILEQKGRAVL